MRRLDPSTYNLFLVVICLVVAFGFFLVWRLRRDVEQDSGEVTDEELLRSFERAYFEGEMEEAEFRRVTQKLRARMGGAPATTAVPEVPGTPEAESTGETPPVEG